MNKTQEIVPGPGAYQQLILTKFDDNLSPKYTFGMPGRRATTSKMNKSQNSQLDTMKSNESPGPGQYNIKGAIGEGPKSSLSYRYKTDIEAKESNQKPGPGSYAPTVDSI